MNLAASARNTCIGSILIALSTSACHAAPNKPSGCPEGFAQDEARASRITTTLKRAPQGEALLEASGTRTTLRFCFGRQDVSAVTTEGALLFDERLADNEAAARLAHLLRHVVDGLSPTPKQGERCEETVERLLHMEADALALEVTLRRAFDVRSPHVVYAFETTFWSAPAEQRSKFLFTYLKEHPSGAPGIDALASAYERRCRLGSR